MGKKCIGLTQRYDRKQVIKKATQLAELSRKISGWSRREQYKLVENQLKKFPSQLNTFDLIDIGPRSGGACRNFHLGAIAQKAGSMEAPVGSLARS